jgi:hypothetical protein
VLVRSPSDAMGETGAMELQENTVVAERFRLGPRIRRSREAKAAAQLHGPHVVPSYHLGTRLAKDGRSPTKPTKAPDLGF